MLYKNISARNKDNIFRNDEIIFSDLRIKISLTLLVRTYDEKSSNNYTIITLLRIRARNKKILFRIIF